MSYKFVEFDTTAFTAADAPTEDELSISGIFIGQTKTVAFILGNTGSSETTFSISTSGNNPTINDDVEYSIDNGATWSAAAEISGVQPNEITDRILVKYTPAEGEVLGVGSFLIRVDEE